MVEVTRLRAPKHGADLVAASSRYGIPLHQWLDLSTGINPIAYPFRDVARAAFQHLPNTAVELRAAAKTYAQSTVDPVAAAGSQTLIQWLPIVRAQMIAARSRVAVPCIGYSEHAFRWQWAGHEIIHYDPRTPEVIDALLAQNAIDVLVVINANNPLGIITQPAQLLAWQQTLMRSHGWLIVDEAFIDPTPQFSVAHHAHAPGLIVLRSLGKFFGLAGVRCGFAFCADDLREALLVAVGPWSVSGPAAAIATQALRDGEWQAVMREKLKVMSARNAALLRSCFSAPIFTHALFNSVELPAACAVVIEDALASEGIRVRRIEIDARASLLRFGLVDPDCGEDWAKFNRCLQRLVYY